MTMGPIRVLLVDNEVDAREWLAEWLRQTHAFDVRTTSTSEEALSQMALANGDFDVVVTDVRLGHGLNGIETMKDMHHLYPEIPVIIITAYGSVDDGVRAMKEGAYHYVFKPLNRDEIVIDIRSAADQRRLKRERDWLRALSDVSEALSAPALDQEGVVRAVYEQALQFIPHAQAFSLALYDDHTGGLSFPLAMDQGQPVRIPSRRLTESSESWGLTGWIVKHARPLLINDVQHETLPVPDAASGEASTSARSFLGLPLVARGQVIGAISVQCHDPFALTPDHQRFLEAVTNQAATAIENTRLYAQAQREISVRTRAEKELRRYQEHLQELVRERTAELQQSESRYRTLFDGMPVPLYRTTAAGQIVDANPAMLQMLGYSRREDLLTANALSHYADPQDRVRWQTLMEQQGVARDFELRLRRCDGTVIWVKDTGRAVKDHRGRVLYYEGSMEDISQRKRAEEELRCYQEHLEDLVEERTAELKRSEERYRTLFDGVPVGLYRSTPSGETMDANLAALEMLGFASLEDMQAVNASEVYTHPGDRARWMSLMEREGVVRDFEMQFRCTDGSLIWVNDTARAVRDEHGQVLYYEGSIEDISARKRAEEELHRAKEAAEAANQAKSTFLANMSHELRTPLNAIIGFTRLVRRRGRDRLPPRDLENLDKVLTSANHLLAQINGVLDLSKIEAGRVDVRPVVCEVEPLVEVCLQTVQPLLEGERVQLVKDLEPNLPSLFTDEEKVRQILINLLSNGIRFTEAGSVTVKATSLGERLLIEVADTGIGIPEEALGRIFEAFRQADGSTTRRYGGTGLGLSISRHLAHLLGGDISVKSQLGVGSTFTVTLPTRYTKPTATALGSSAAVQPRTPRTKP